MQCAFILSLNIMVSVDQLPICGLGFKKLGEKITAIINHLGKNIFI